MHCLAAMVADKCGHDFTGRDMVEIFKSGVMRGFILDNDLPTDGSHGNWYRCYVRDPWRFVVMVGEYIGRKIEAMEVYREKNIVEHPGAGYIITEWQTPNGSHFTVKAGRMDIDSYDPGPHFARTGIKSVRGWSVLDKTAKKG